MDKHGRHYNKIIMKPQPVPEIKHLNYVSGRRRKKTL